MHGDLQIGQQKYPRCPHSRGKGLLPWDNNPGGSSSNMCLPALAGCANARHMCSAQTIYFQYIILENSHSYRRLGEKAIFVVSKYIFLNAFLL